MHKLLKKLLESFFTRTINMIEGCENNLGKYFSKLLIEIILSILKCN